MRYYSIKPNMIFEIYSNTFRLKMNGSRIMVLKRQVVLPLIKFLLTIESTVHLQLYGIYIYTVYIYTVCICIYIYIYMGFRRKETTW